MRTLFRRRWCAHHGTRPTIRQGIALLRNEGLVTVQRPYGTIVRDPHARPGQLDQRILDRSFEPASDLAWADVGDPAFLRTDATVAQAQLLGIEPGEPMLNREVLQETDSGARRFTRLSVPFSVAADLNAPGRDSARLPAPAELYRWFAAHVEGKLTVTDYIRARLPVGDEIHAMRIAHGAPLLIAWRVVAADRPLALEEIRTPADQVELAYPVPLTAKSRTPVPATRTKHLARRGARRPATG